VPIGASALLSANLIGKAELKMYKAAPLTDAGVTTFNALRNSGAGSGDLVAILGVGSLGHLTWASSLPRRWASGPLPLRAPHKEATMKPIQMAYLDEFKAQFQGNILLPGDSDYDEVRRIWNAMIDRRPALIARCTSPDGVVQAVGFARTTFLSRSGGADTTSRAMPSATRAS
jgi:hypothetical protein